MEDLKRELKTLRKQRQEQADDLEAMNAIFGQIQKSVANIKTASKAIREVASSDATEATGSPSKVSQST